MELKFTSSAVNGKMYFEYVFVIHISLLLRQQYHDSKSVIFQEKILKVLMCYNFL